MYFTEKHLEIAKEVKATLLPLSSVRLWCHTAICWWPEEQHMAFTAVDVYSTVESLMI